MASFKVSVHPSTDMAHWFGSGSRTSCLIFCMTSVQDRQAHCSTSVQRQSHPVPQADEVPSRGDEHQHVAAAPVRCRISVRSSLLRSCPTSSSDDSSEDSREGKPGASFPLGKGPTLSPPIADLNPTPCGGTVTGGAACSSIPLKGEVGAPWGPVPRKPRSLQTRLPHPLQPRVQVGAFFARISTRLSLRVPCGALRAWFVAHPGRHACTLVLPDGKSMRSALSCTTVKFGSTYSEATVVGWPGVAKSARMQPGDDVMLRAQLPLVPLVICIKHSLVLQRQRTMLPHLRCWLQSQRPGTYVCTFCPGRSQIVPQDLLRCAGIPSSTVGTTPCTLVVRGVGCEKAAISHGRRGGGHGSACLGTGWSHTASIRHLQLKPGSMFTVRAKPWNCSSDPLVIYLSMVPDEVPSPSDSAPEDQDVSSAVEPEPDLDHGDKQVAPSPAMLPPPPPPPQPPPQRWASLQLLPLQEAPVQPVASKTDALQEKESEDAPARCTVSVQAGLALQIPASTVSAWRLTAGRTAACTVKLPTGRCIGTTISCHPTLHHGTLGINWQKGAEALKLREGDSLQVWLSRAGPPLQLSVSVLSQSTSIHDLLVPSAQPQQQQKQLKAVVDGAAKEPTAIPARKLVGACIRRATGSVVTHKAPTRNPLGPPTSPASPKGVVWRPAGGRSPLKGSWVIRLRQAAAKSANGSGESKDAPSAQLQHVWRPPVFALPGEHSPSLPSPPAPLLA